MIGEMLDGIVLLVLASACLHAMWNFATRKVQGNLAVLWLSLLLAGLVSLPPAVVFAVHTGVGMVGVLCLAATAIVHGLYFSLLARAYERGEISLVYPIARGTGVAGTALVVGLLGLETITPLAAAGISAVVAGILLVGMGHLGQDRRGRNTAIGLAVLVGLTVVAYSLVDKLAVSRDLGGFPGGRLHPLTYICGVFLGPALAMAPYVLSRARTQIPDAWRQHRRYVLTIGPASLCTYLLILFAYQLGPVSYIVSFREFAVVIGSAMGVGLLREKLTLRKVLGIVVVTGGLVLIKLS